MSVVAPVSGLVSTVLPVAVALGEGERPGIGVYAGALLCLVAIVMTSAAGDARRRERRRGAVVDRPGRGRAIGYGSVSGAAFGLFFLLIRNAGQSGEFWPVAAGRVGELARVLIAAAVLRRGLLSRGGADGRLLVAAAGAGVIDVVANICYVAATRTGAFGLAVVLASLYPGFTVLLARVVLGERLRWVQRGWPRPRRDRHPAGHDVSAAGSKHRAAAGRRLGWVKTTDQFGAGFHVPRGF